MKRLAALLALQTLLTLTSLTMAEDVLFTDANLEAKVRSELGTWHSNKVTDADMETLGYFVAVNNGISNIDGLDYATNIKQLGLSNNQIEDISPLSKLTKMRQLYLEGNQISDISALSEMSDLKWLYLKENQIRDISPVSGLKNLTKLNLNYNQISDISAVSSLNNLEELHLAFNHISDISGVSGLRNLDILNLSGNQIEDISEVSGLTETQFIGFYKNQISDISALSGLSSLASVGLSHNNIETLDLSASDLLSLTHFEISNNPVKNVILKDATLNQNKTFAALMKGGGSYNNGIAEIGGVLRLDMSGVDFDGISNVLYVMNEMDDLEELLLAGAINLDGNMLANLIGELDSLNYLDLTGTWDIFDTTAQISLNSWDALEGNTLVVPEPATLILVGIGGLVLRRRNNMVDGSSLKKS